jgi:hypothetical protein
VCRAGSPNPASLLLGAQASRLHSPLVPLGHGQFCPDRRRRLALRNSKGASCHGRCRSAGGPSSSDRRGASGAWGGVSEPRQPAPWERRRLACIRRSFPLGIGEFTAKTRRAQIVEQPSPSAPQAQGESAAERLPCPAVAVLPEVRCLGPEGRLRCPSATGPPITSGPTYPSPTLTPLLGRVPPYRLA